MPEPESQPQQPKVICVLGMHRSGTSLLSGTLRLLNVYLGPDEHLLPTDEEANKKGFWENRLIVDLNNELLSRLGGDWHNLPDFPPAWPSSPEVGDLRQKARALISQEFGDARIWGWKDPRACLTLPFWRRLLPPMSYIICLRNPVDVARSLARVHGLATWKSAKLWVEHVRSALEHTATAPRLVLFYEDFIDDWRSSVARMSGFLGLTADQKAQNEIEEFIESGMEHHRTSVLDAIEEVEVGYSARALYLALRLYDYYQRKESLVATEVDRIVSDALNNFGHHSAKAQADLDELTTGLAEQRGSAADLESKVAERGRELELLNTELTTKDELVRSLYAQIAQQTLSIQSLSMALISKDAAIDSLEKHAAQQEHLMRDLQTTVRDFAASAEQKDSLINELNAQVVEREARLNRITNSRGWRLLSYYGRLKHGYLIPLFKFMGSGSARPQVTKLDRKP